MLRTVTKIHVHINRGPFNRQVLPMLKAFEHWRLRYDAPRIIPRFATSKSISLLHAYRRVFIIRMQSTNSYIERWRTEVGTKNPEMPRLFSDNVTPERSGGLPGQYA